jgi:hypothetical protein
MDSVGFPVVGRRGGGEYNMLSVLSPFPHNLSFTYKYMRIIAIVKMPAKYFSFTVYILFYFENCFRKYTLS